MGYGFEILKKKKKIRGLNKNLKKYRFNVKVKNVAFLGKSTRFQTRDFMFSNSYFYTVMLNRRCLVYDQRTYLCNILAGQATLMLDFCQSLAANWQTCLLNSNLDALI